MFLLHDSFPMNFAFTYKLHGEKKTSNTNYLELIKRRSKVQEKNMSSELALNFDQ